MKVKLPSPSTNWGWVAIGWLAICLVSLQFGGAEAQIRYDYSATVTPIGGGAPPPIIGRTDFDQEEMRRRKEEVFDESSLRLQFLLNAFDSSEGVRLGTLFLLAFGDPDPFLDTTLTFQNESDQPLRFDFESALNMFAPVLPFGVRATSEIELIDGIDGLMADGTASLVPPDDFLEEGLGMVRPGVGTLGSVLAFEFFFPPDLNQGDGLVAPGASMESSSTTVGTPPNFPRPGSDNWDAMLLNLGFVLSPMDTAVFHTRITVVPEPATFIVLGTGCVIFLGLARRRRVIPTPPRDSSNDIG